MVSGGIAGRYAGVVFDVDGVLCRGETPIPGADRTLAELHHRRIPYALVTNNASRTPTGLAAALAAMGLTVPATRILTSPLVAAEMIDPGTRCLVVGSTGLLEALQARGLLLVEDPAAAEAVVVGFDPHLVWDDLRRATVALHRGARFIGTNDDATFPSAEGLWPGNGAILAALATASGRQPEIAGKPHPPLYEAAAALLPPGPLLMVGDRIETDIHGAAALGWDTALVLTGVTSREHARTAGASYVLDSVTDLLDG
jgi:4-nitrophenyl phosphatase